MCCSSVGKLSGVAVLAGLTLSIAGGCGASTPRASLMGGNAAAAPINAVPEAEPQATPRQQIAMVTPVAAPPVTQSPALPARAASEDVVPLHPAEMPVRHERLTTEQVAMWASQGMRDDIIIDRIERAQTIIRLSAADEQSLRQQGVSEDVIFALKESARR